jgi:hypothetical protein
MRKSGLATINRNLAQTRTVSCITSAVTVTVNEGIRNLEKRVEEIVVRELKRAKPGVWGCV